MNRCVSPANPFSCGDGSCSTSASDCKTCSYFCRSIEQCVASRADCDMMDEASYYDLRKNMEQTCPRGAPYRCVTDGRCVQNASMCNNLQTESKAFTLDSTFTGPLIKASCPTSSPIKCIDGTCVNSY